MQKVFKVILVVFGLALVGFILVKPFSEKPPLDSVGSMTETESEVNVKDVAEDEKELVPIQEENLNDLSDVLVDPLKLNVTDVNVMDLKETDADVYGFYKKGTEDYEFCQEIGARVVHVPEYSTYFVYWLPDDWENMDEQRALVMMHGSMANAYAMFPHLYDTAKREGFALISIQWGWPAGSLNGDYIYLHDSDEGLRVAYDLMVLGLDYIDVHFGLDKELSAWNGFSRGSSASVAYAYLDKESGNDYFQLFMSIAGPANSLDPLIANILNGTYGNNALTGKNFYLWCGTANVNVTPNSDGEIVDTCQRMQDSFHPLTDLGASVDFIKTEGGEHTTWNEGELSEELQQEAVDLWFDLS